MFEHDKEAPYVRIYFNTPKTPNGKTANECKQLTNVRKREERDPLKSIRESNLKKIKLRC